MSWLGSWGKRRKMNLPTDPNGLELDTRYNFDDHGFQGVALDGLGYIYISNSTELYKYRLSDSELIASNLTANEDGTDTEQINGIHYYDGKIYAGAMDWVAGPPYHSKIKVYDASDCSYIEEHTISDSKATEGCAYAHGKWWICYINSDTVDTYNDSWEYLATYTLPYSSNFMAQGISWDGNFLWYNNHSDASAKVTNVVEWDEDSSTFSAVIQFAHIGTGDKCSQGLCIDPDDHTLIWMAERDTNGDNSNLNRIVKANVSYTLPSNFPLLVYISSSCGLDSQDITSIFTELGEEDKKIAFTGTDGTTQLYAEVEKWNYTGTAATSEAWIWVKIPDTVTEYFYMYYDVSQDDNLSYIGDNNNTDPIEAVWTEDFISVHHLQEDNNDVLGLKNSADVSAYNATAFLCAHDESSKSDGGKSFDQDPIKQRVQVADAHINGKDIYTVGAWFKNDDSTTPAVYISFRGDTNESDNYLWMDNDPVGKFRIKRGGTHADEGGQSGVFGVWQQVYIVFTSATNAKLYVNGVCVDDTIAIAAQDHADSPMNFCYFHDDYVAALYQWLGKVDEIRLIDSACSDAWILANYRSENDDLVSWEEEEELVTSLPSTSMISLMQVLDMI